MIKRIIMLVAAISMILVVGVNSVSAQGGPGSVYVDPSRTSGNEDGSQTNPYNDPDEGEAYAQAQSDGAYLYVRRPDGTWPTTPEYIKPVGPSAGGIPFPEIVVYVLVITSALLLIWAGLYFVKHSRKIQSNR